MAVLNNARHERFAQELAKGNSATRAYIAAGYAEKGAEPNSSRLISNDKVSSRVNELKTEAAKRTVLTIERLTNDLLRIADKGEKLAEAPGLSVARAAIMDAAKLNGLVVDKAEHSGPNGGPIKTETRTWREVLRQQNGG